MMKRAAMASRAGHGSPRSCARASSSGRAVSRIHGNSNKGRKTAMSTTRVQSRGNTVTPARVFPDLSSLMGRGATSTVDKYGDVMPRKKRKERRERLPLGQARYEIMVVLRPDLGEDEWEEELARFESALDKAGVTEIDSLVRGRQRMAFPIDGCIYGLYVLYTFVGDTTVGVAVQEFFTEPDLRPQKPILRHMCHRTQ